MEAQSQSPSKPCRSRWWLACLRYTAAATMRWGRMYLHLQGCIVCRERDEGAWKTVPSQIQWHLHHNYQQRESLVRKNSGFITIKPCPHCRRSGPVHYQRSEENKNQNIKRENGTAQPITPPSPPPSQTTSQPSTPKTHPRHHTHTPASPTSVASSHADDDPHATPLSTTPPRPPPKNSSNDP